MSAAGVGIVRIVVGGGGNSKANYYRLAKKEKITIVEQCID
jgi:hypothetical protein